MPFYAIIDHLMYKKYLKNTSKIDFGREMWTKFHLKYYV